ncbi:TIGR00341 family protein [Flavobacterium rhizosphaerae]|uniref:TIGR00341 family protein n=1 Tax=Flavobacterium rhizosphaerae TaxID=3163298 RepID=A0ABW8YWT9_9FLAO
MRKFSTIFNLREGEDDREKTLESVRKNINFRGANLWILACAILVASIGLNLNSAAVVIGAMLISPLMGPIVGAGFALGIYDFTLLKKSLKNLLNATAVGLAFSALYFFISPFKDVQSEILARTSPTLYDILIAFFGGIVGAIAVTREEKGNPIPGVAIATALMPPLCTAGYGIGTWQWSYFIGAFYLYCINCVFIGISTFAIIKYLKYPPKKQVNEKQQKRVRVLIPLIVTIMILPGGYLAYSLYREQQFKKNIDEFVENEFTDKGCTIVFKKSTFNSVTKKLELAFLSKRFDKSDIKHLTDLMDSNKYLEGTELVIRQDSTDRFNALKGDILSQIRSSENELSEKDVRIMQLEKTITENTFDNQKLLAESRALFPQITSLSVSKNALATQNDSVQELTAVIIETPKPLSDADKEKYRKWLNERLSVKNVYLFRKETPQPEPTAATPKKAKAK